MVLYQGQNELESLKEIILEKILKTKEGLVILIKGNWGTGKTHFTMEMLNKLGSFVFNRLETSPDFNYKNIAYISLFGKQSIQEIKEEIILQISNIKKFSSKLSKVFKSLPTSELKSIGELLSIFSTLGDLSNLILVFDDFERIVPERISPKEVFGLISFLKENLNCKCILILNEDALQKLNEKVFAEYNLYKEKIVDFEVIFSPTVERNFNIVKKSLGNIPFESFLLEFLKAIKENNIRLIKNLALLLSNISFLANDDFKEYSNYVREYVFYFLSICYIKRKFGKEVEDLKGTSPEEEPEGLRGTVSLLKERNFLPFLSGENPIYRFCKYEFIDEDTRSHWIKEIKESLSEKAKQKQCFKTIIQDNLRKWKNELLYNLKKENLDIDIDTVLECIENITIQQQIYLYLEISNLLILQDKVLNETGNQKYKLSKMFKGLMTGNPENKLLKLSKVIKDLIFQNISGLKTEDLLHLAEEIENMKEYREKNQFLQELEEQLKKEIKKKLSLQTTSLNCEEVAELLRDFQGTAYQIELFLSIPKELLKLCIINNPEILEMAIKFLKTFSGSGIKDIESICNKIKTIFKELSTESDLYKKKLYYLDRIFSLKIFQQTGGRDVHESRGEGAPETDRRALKTD